MCGCVCTYSAAGQKAKERRQLPLIMEVNRYTSQLLQNLSIPEMKVSGGNHECALRSAASFHVILSLLLEPKTMNHFHASRHRVSFTLFMIVL